MSYKDRIKYNLPIFRHHYSVLYENVSRKRRTNVVHIYCYHTLTSWWDGNLPEGTAGSEAAVVELSSELARLGWDVTVYNNCGVARRIGGVRYIPSWRFNPHSYVENLILWRSAVLARKPLNAKRIILWLHDIPRPALTTSEIKNVSFVVFLSNFHRRSCEAVPDSKAITIRNAIVIPNIINNPHTFVVPGKCIYASAPDRGLECLLGLWPRIHEQVPFSTLHLYYGWTTWTFFNNKNLWSKLWRKRIDDTISKTRGISTQYCYISPSELWHEFSTSVAWLYPTQCLETSCINAMKAQAAGAVPVVTNVGALTESVGWGIRLDCEDIYTNQAIQRDFVASVVSLLSSGVPNWRSTMTDWAKSAFSWSSTGQQWCDLLTSDR